MTTVLVLPTDRAILAALTAIPGGHPVGFAEAPDGAYEAILAGTGADYLILYPISGSARDGSIEDPYADAAIPYQITIIAKDAGGARWLLDRIEPALAAILVPGAITGRRVTQIVPDDFGNVRPDTGLYPEGEETGLIIATPRYTIHTTPA